MADPSPLARDALAGAHPLVVRQPARVAPLLAASVLAWVFLAWIALDMDTPAAQLMMPDSAEWSVPNTLAVGAMWAVMMAAMMLPSAMPMMLAFTGISMRSKQPGRGRAFVAGYLGVWFAFSVAATALQWLLQAAGWIDPMATSQSAALTAALLLVAGLYQFSPLKKLCLASCRSPFAFLLGEWRPGLRGAAAMGVRHGLFCLGCCWALMGLLFVGGAMNLGWVAALAVAVGIEKMAPRGETVALVLGGALLAGGVLKFLALAV